MSALQDLLALLDRWDEWKIIRQTPSQLDLLAQRVSELEQKLARCPGEGCPKCGELELRVVSSKPDPTMGELGVRQYHVKCQKCSFEDWRSPTPE